MAKKVSVKLDSKYENLLTEKLPQSPLKLKYETEVRKRMMDKFGYKSVMEVPK